MVLQSNGQITFTDIKNEFDKGNNLSDYYGAAIGIPTTGNIKFSDFYGKAKIIKKYITSNTINVVISSLFTNEEWQSPNPKEVIINSGVIVGSTRADWAISTGTGINANSTLTLTNNGSIQGTGGGNVNWNGGNAIYAQVPLKIDNNGQILAGGGRGGNGGSGGWGGSGIVYYDYWEGVRWNKNYNDWINYYRKEGWLQIVWDGQRKFFQNGRYWDSTTEVDGNDGWRYYRGAYATNTNDDYHHYQLSRKQTRSYYTGGGAGGAGGAGGIGRGYNQSNQDGSWGAGGSAGGQNAGWGGTGGKGGNGGNWGSYGGTGNTGNNGGSGNAAVGNGGSPGGGGGAPGYVVATNGSAITWIKRGTTAGLG